ncbi:unnamed protein product [Larinioides sclopetarius]|uniref:Uncharacterized protein n=1 Tax=Larinioides sclopetarius TaxID=280406 RepID=A0AAV1ZYN8_9ARAC
MDDSLGRGTEGGPGFWTRRGHLGPVRGPGERWTHESGRDSGPSGDQAHQRGQECCIRAGPVSGRSCRGRNPVWPDPSGSEVECRTGGHRACRWGGGF